MTKERLEEIIDDLPYSIRYEGGIEVLIKYAKEQAERVEELEKENQELREAGIFFESGYCQYEEENQRYKQALKDTRKSLFRVQGFEPAVIEASKMIDDVLRGETE